MALAVHIPGPAEVLLDTGSSNALESLGYTLDGAQINENVQRHEVMGDQGGGQGGIPIEVQFLGEYHEITLVLTKFDSAVFAKVNPDIYGANNGTINTTVSSVDYSNIGVSMFANCFRLLIKPTLQGTVQTAHVRNYPRAILVSKGNTVGTKAKQQRFVFRAYPNASGVIWNTTTS